MAKRSGPPDIKSQLGTLFTAAMQQLDQVREVVQQRTRAGRAQLDLVLLRRKRREVLAQLGEAVVKLAQAGRIDEEELPELSAALSRIEALDEQIEREEQGGGREEERDLDDDRDGEFDEEAHTRVRSRDPRAARAAAAGGDDEADEADEAVDDDDDDYPPPDDEEDEEEAPPPDDDDEDEDENGRRR